MIPHSLILEGIYSYKERTEIDFRPLLDAHLFGIFGPVGSGKSSILEAITYCLYGRLERLNQREGLSANLMNLDAGAAYLELEFETLSTPGIFKSVVAGKRRKAGPDFKRSQYRWTDDAWQPVTDEEVQQAIGLSYEHFTRTVIIPQGKFQEFLQLGDTQRTQMLQELFRLERFDLSHQVARLKSQTLSSKHELQGQITSLLQIDLPPQEALEKQNKELTALLAEAQKTLLFCQKRLEVATTWLELRQDLHQKLDQQKNDAAQVANLVVQLQLQLPSLKEAATAHEQLPRRENELEQLKNLARMQTFRIESEKLEGEYQAQASAVAHIESQLEAAEKSMIQARKRLEELRHKSESLEVITERQSVLLSFREASRQVRDLAEKGRDLRRQHEEALLRLRQKTADLLGPLGLAFDVEEIPDELLNTWLDEQRVRIQRAQEAYEARRTQAGLGPFAAELKDGEPCPLCGATDHPAPFHSREHEQQLLPLKEAWLIEQQKEDILRKAADTWRESTHLKTSQELQIEQLRKEYLQADKRYKSIQTHLNAWQVDEAGLAQWLDVQKKQAVEVGEADKVFHKADATHREQLTQQAQAKDRLALLQTCRKEQEARIATLRERLSETVEHTWGHRSTEDIVHHVAQEEKALVAIRDTYNTLSHQVQALEKDIHTREALLQRIDEEIAVLQKRFDASSLQLRTYHDEDLADDAEDHWHLRIDTWRQAQSESEEVVARLSGELHIVKDRLLFHEKNTARLARLQVELDAVEVRLSNIQVLDGLFRAKGLVEFAATRYLNQIIQLANERFSRMTRHKLRMELDGSRIMVRDYYHGGAMRLIKTLSGGQLFQASLCLALAMASTIRNYRENNRDFFFLDEGFGTQDTASLDLVLQTLKDLRSENRSVGLISHVEALRQEVGAYLSIRQDPVRGSLVTTSY